MRYKNLTTTNKDFIRRVYEQANKGKFSKEEAQIKIADMFNVTPRTVRNWAKRMDMSPVLPKEVAPSKIMIYDIETSRPMARVWWTGKQYVGANQFVEEPQIITVAWKWLGSEEVKYLTWDDDGKTQSDENLMREFLKEYNKADLIVGQNNDRFDNRWINARAMKYGFDVNVFVRSLDIMKESKRLFRMLGYSMDYMTKFADVTHKRSTEGIKMWDMIQDGTPEQKAEYMQKMVDYNIGDIISTEDMYLRFRKYMGHKIHFGVMNGGEKYTCPNCGGSDIQLNKTTVTPAGTVQRIMKCNVDGSTYKITNKQYMSFLDFKIREDEN